MEMIQVRWAGDFDATARMPDGESVLLKIGDLFEMLREEAELRSDVEIVVEVPARATED